MCWLIVKRHTIRKSHSTLSSPESRWSPFNQWQLSEHWPTWLATDGPQHKTVTEHCLRLSANEIKNVLHCSAASHKSVYGATLVMRGLTRRNSYVSAAPTTKSRLVLCARRRQRQAPQTSLNATVFVRSILCSQKCVKSIPKEGGIKPIIRIVL